MAFLRKHSRQISTKGLLVSMSTTLLQSAEASSLEGDVAVVGCAPRYLVHACSLSMALLRKHNCHLSMMCLCINTSTTLLLFVEASSVKVNLQWLAAPQGTLKRHAAQRWHSCASTIAISA